MENSCPPQPKQKLFKQQRNLSRKQDLKPFSQIDRQTERVNKYLGDKYGEEEEKRKPILSHHVVEVNVEINRVDSICNESQKTPLHPVKTCSKRKSPASQRVRKKTPDNITATDVGSPPPRCDSVRTSVPSSPSQMSVISDTAVEELCDLRNYYSKQLKRINYISHEYLGQPAEPGVLACIWEPLKSFRLPRRVTIAQTARSLWTRVSGRRKLVHR